MGYFSNGSEGQRYQERYCFQCVHYGPQEGPGCPIWAAHLFYVSTRDKDAIAILDMLIPRAEALVWNDQCKFYEGPEPGTTEHTYSIRNVQLGTNEE